MLTGQRICQERGFAFPSVFLHQFVLSQAPVPDLTDWETPDPAQGWFLSHCPKLDRQNILDASGQSVGWLLGVAVSGAGEVQSKSPLMLDAAASDTDFWTNVEDNICRMAGKFVAIILCQAGQRAYFDPVVDMPAVYNAKDGLVATSPLLASRGELKVNPHIDYNLILSRGGNFGMQQTCHPDVLRAMANHYLDLSSFRLIRHWPTETTNLAEIDDIDSAAQTMTSRLQQTISAIIGSYSCALPLSGGNDSRILAYLARDQIDDVKFCFTHRINWISKVDCFVGAQIAADLGRTLTLIDGRRAIQEGHVSRVQIRQLKRMFRMRTGFHKEGSEDVLVAAALVPDCELVLRGNVLDIAGANQWPRRNFAFSVDHAIAKLVLGGRPAEENTSYWGDRYSAWMATLPECARHRTYDLAFTELLLPNTLGANLIGLGNPNYVNPFNDRDLIALCTRISPVARAQGRLYSLLHHHAGASSIPATSDVRQSDDSKQAMNRFFDDLAEGPVVAEIDGRKHPDLVRSP